MQAIKVTGECLFFAPTFHTAVVKQVKQMLLRHSRLDGFGAAVRVLEITTALWLFTNNHMIMIQAAVRE